MDQYKVEFLPATLSDLEEITFYYSQYTDNGESHNYAMRIHDAVVNAADRLSFMPMCGIKVPDKKLSAQGYRMLVIEKKYLMFYSP